MKKDKQKENCTQTGLPMRWHHFLVWACIPLLLCISLYLTLVPLLPQLHLSYDFNSLLITLYGWHVFHITDFASLQALFLMYLAISTCLLCFAWICLLLRRWFGFISWMIYMIWITIAVCWFSFITMQILVVNEEKVRFFLNSLVASFGTQYTWLSISLPWLITGMVLLIGFLLLGMILQIRYYRKRESYFSDFTKAEEDTGTWLTEEERQEIQYCPFCGTPIRSHEIIYCENCGRRIR